MKNQILTVEEVAKILKLSKSESYKRIKNLNDELEQKGYLTLTAKIPSKYLYERYGLLDEED